ncbi:HDOD domain-containing protein [Thermodesulfobacteriota bacterium]
MKEKLEKLAQNIEQIPTLPVISQKIMRVMENEDSTIKDIAKIIENDQSLTLKLLKIANSAFYGSLGKVSSLDNALVKLGMNEVKSIVLGVSIRNFFSDTSDGTFDRERFWRHSIICSQVAKFLGSYFKITNDDSLFLSGLIHDMGKVVLDEYFHEDFLEIIDYVDSTGSTFSEAEKSIIGTTHYQIAAKILKQWEFPDEVIMQVLYHHAPWCDANFEDSSIAIYLSNILTKLAGYSCHPNEKQIDPIEFSGSSEADFIIKNGFDLEPEVIENLIKHIQEFVMEEADNVLKLFD